MKYIVILTQPEILKKLIFTVLFIIQGIFVLAQSNALPDIIISESGAAELEFATTKAEAMKLADRDIEKGLPFILL